jgi:hypothetical protein
MGTSIYIYCPSGEEGALRGDLEDDVEGFLGDAAEFVGGGSGVQGFNLDFELAEDEDVELWIGRLREFLKQANARPSTFFEVFPEDWEPGMPWRRIEVFGEDRWLTKREHRATSFTFSSVQGAPNWRRATASRGSGRRLSDVPSA